MSKFQYNLIRSDLLLLHSNDFYLPNMFLSVLLFPTRPRFHVLQAETLKPACSQRCLAVILFMLLPTIWRPSPNKHSTASVFILQGSILSHFSTQQSWSAPTCLPISMIGYRTKFQRRKMHSSVSISSSATALACISSHFENQSSMSKTSPEHLTIWSVSPMHSQVSVDHLGHWNLSMAAFQFSQRFATWL